MQGPDPTTASASHRSDRRAANGASLTQAAVCSRGYSCAAPPAGCRQLRCAASRLPTATLRRQPRGRMVEPASGPDPCEVGDDAAEHASRIRLQRATVRETLHATATPREGAGDGASETSEAAKRPMATAADATSTEVVETTKKREAPGK